MKNKYILLSLFGFILPNYFSIRESFENGNILLWTDPASTFSAMFSNNINAAFSTDLLWVVLVFFFWLWSQTATIGNRKAWLLTILTMLFGMAGTFPLLLHWRSKDK